MAINESISVKLETADGNEMRFKAEGGVIGGVAEIANWISLERLDKMIERLEKVRAKRRAAAIESA